MHVVKVTCADHSYTSDTSYHLGVHAFLRLSDSEPDQTSSTRAGIIKFLTLSLYVP